MKRLSAALIGGLVLMMLSMSPASAYTKAYSGQGWTQVDGAYQLNTTICYVDDSSAESQSPYLLWVLTANDATTATITGPWGTASMTQSGQGNGSFKYVSGWYSYADLSAVSASYNGSRDNGQLVVSHGCPPVQKQGAWCSPGFWKNADNAAWSKTGYTRETLFNGSVSPYFHTPLSTDASLGTVLAAPKTYSGKASPGTSGYSLNAFNAVGAFLTNSLTGYAFDPSLMSDELLVDPCPLNNHGDWKE